MTDPKIIELVKSMYKENVLPYNKVPCSGKCYDEKEIINLIEASFEGWWTEDKWVTLFEKKLEEFTNMRDVITVNSGSSANLVCAFTLASPQLGEKRIKKGDEIISVAACFPTTINPFVLIGAVPVFVDVELGTYNANVEQIERAITQKTKAIVLAHTLGNPFDLKRISQLCEKHNLWLVEDNCDALGSAYEGRLTGTFGDIATCSFYPAHHITTAEGGALFINDAKLSRLARSIRDWGRDCWCSTGRDNTCGKRFEWELGQLPKGYDHKYIYSELGFNLKMTDLQAAIGCAQMDKLEGFILQRKKNFNYLGKKLESFKNKLILPEPTKGADPSWFGFPLTVKDGNRIQLINYLNERGIATRLLFGGNIVKQPYFIDYKIPHRYPNELVNTDIVMNNTFWIGVFPMLDEKHLDYVYEKMREYYEA
ncbi:lipopolysaccharide biosynthesis protein RfbH [Candidatus Woesearchaeota archaeon]|nr:lipopolysaccharide biosynthesis protein RfbH [Candidatus Woesearchaeota archaeon]